jgi:hypothetical protein
MSHSAQKICYTLVPFDGQYKLQCQLTYIVLEELLTRLSPKKNIEFDLLDFCMFERQSNTI